jgi:Domain of unknown function (DUF1883)
MMSTEAQEPVSNLPELVESPLGVVCMNFLQYELDAGPHNKIQVTLDKQANVRLMDSSNFQRYKAGQEHRYYGGLARVSPITLTAPYQGHWYLVIDLGGYPGTVRASVQVY